MANLKTTAGSILLIFLTASLFAAGQAEDGASISIGLLPDVDSIPFVLADINGYYEEEGLSVDIMQFKNPVDRDTAFQSGQTDAVISDLLAACLSLNGGFKVRVTSMTNGSYKLLTSPESKARSIRDLEGKSMGISKNTIIEYAADKMLATAGLTGDDIKKEIIPQIPLRLELLGAGKIDAAVLAEPLATAAVISGSRVLISTDKLDINPGILLVNKEFLDADKETLAAMYRAYNKAVAFINNNDKEGYIDDIIKAMGFPEAARDLMELPEYTPAAAPPENEIKDVSSWLYARDLIKKEYTYNELVDPSCLP
jgi:NitT/TauT family transport system substrate-binding protein